jgi:hypothetical protein
VGIATLRVSERLVEFPHMEKRDDLVAKVAKLEKMNEHYVVQDKRLREEFAKSFKWGQPKHGRYSYSAFDTVNKEEWEWRVPTWEQVFVEIGKLKSLADFRDYEGNLSELECKLEDLEKRIKKEIHPNL